MILVNDLKTILSDGVWLVVFWGNFYENKTMSLGHRGTHPADLEIEVIIKIKSDLPFKITVYQEISPTNSDS